MFATSLFSGGTALLKIAVQVLKTAVAVVTVLRASAAAE
jgi:hypothetical protein